MNHLFWFGDLAIASNVLLPELLPVSAEEPQLWFELVHPASGSELEVHWYHHWHRNGDDEPWLSFAHLNDGYLLRFPSQADFFVSSDTRHVRCVPRAGKPDSNIRHLFLDQVMPLVLSRREQLVLHASAVVTPVGAIAFAGMTGAGKSTLGASFAVAGYPLLTDDCLVLRDTGSGWSVIGSYSGTRLWRDSFQHLFGPSHQSIPVADYTHKCRIEMCGNSAVQPQPVPLAALFILDSAADCADVQSPQLSGTSAFMKLMNFVYNLDITDRELHTRQFQCVSRLMREVKIRQLLFPRMFTILPIVRSHLLACALYE